MDSESDGIGVDDVEHGLDATDDDAESGRGAYTISIIDVETSSERFNESLEVRQH